MLSSANLWWLPCHGPLAVTLSPKCGRREAPLRSEPQTKGWGATFLPRPAQTHSAHGQKVLPSTTLGAEPGLPPAHGLAKSDTCHLAAFGGDMRRQPRRGGAALPGEPENPGPRLGGSQLSRTQRPCPGRGSRFRGSVGGAGAYGQTRPQSGAEGAGPLRSRAARPSRSIRTQGGGSAFVCLGVERQDRW